MYQQVNDTSNFGVDRRDALDRGDLRTQRPSRLTEKKQGPSAVSRPPCRARGDPGRSCSQKAQSSLQRD